MTTRRSVSEWIGKTPDSAIPTSVKDRIVERQGGCCAIFGTRFSALDKPVFDHITPLRDGGENRESNLQALCRTAHLAKTRHEATERAKVSRVRANHFGYARQSSRPMPGSKASGLRKRMDGTVERRER